MPTTPRLAAETVSCSITSCDRPPSPSTTGSRRPSSPGCSGWPWSGWRCCSSSVRRSWRSPGLPLACWSRSCCVGVAGRVGVGWWLRSRAWVLRCTDDGYRVRLVRGAGVTRGAVERRRGRRRRPTAATSPASSCGCATAGPPRSRSACWPPTGAVRPRPPGPAAARPRAAAALRPLDSARTAALPCNLLRGEASPSPVYGARLLSGFGSTPHRGFKSRRLRCASPRRRTAPTRGWEPSKFLTFLAAGVSRRSRAARRPRPRAVAAVAAAPAVRRSLSN